MVLFVLFRVIMVNIKAGDSDHTFCITETDKRSFFLWPRENLLILILIIPVVCVPQIPAGSLAANAATC